jgi:hypothetical protein
MLGTAQTRYMVLHILGTVIHHLTIADEIISLVFFNKLRG